MNQTSDGIEGLFIGLLIVVALLLFFGGIKVGMSEVQNDVLEEIIKIDGKTCLCQEVVFNSEELKYFKKS